MATTKNNRAGGAAAGSEPSSATTAPFAGLADAPARWMPERVAEAWTKSLAEASKVQWPARGPNEAGITALMRASAASCSGTC